jgi:hypothetical protein
MSSFDWKGSLGKIAPWLAATLGGPAAGVAVGALCKVVGLEPTIDNAQKAAEMAAAGSLTGDQFLALKAAESAHQERMQALGYGTLIDLEKISAADRDSARQREIKTSDSWTPRILAAFVVLSWIGVSSYIVSHGFIAPGAPSKLDSNIEPMLMRLLGTLDAALTFVLGYYFGSSAGSDRKSEILNKALSDK